MAATYRCGLEPGMLQSLHKHNNRSDTVDVSFLRWSNFHVRQDDVTGELRLHMTRFFARQPPVGPPDWTAGAMMYRIGI